MKISVVIPFYNTPVNLFKDCLESVKALDPYEIILVDDCSTDEIIIELAKQYGKYYNTDHQSGHDGIPFNLGVEKATGDYICKVDSDDILLRLPKSMNTDFMFANCKRVERYKDSGIEEFILSPRAIFGGMVIKREVMLKFPLMKESIFFNDNLLVMRLLHNGYTYSYSEQESYIYLSRENSIQTNLSPLYHRLRNIQTVAKFCQLENISKDKSIYYLKLAVEFIKYGHRSLKLKD